MSSLEKCFSAVEEILNHLPQSWVELTTHRLDIYDEEQAKSQFLEQLIALQSSGNYSIENLEQLPTAYDYIRLGHQLSSVLEWILAEINQLPTEQVITFTSTTMPILAILRKNALNNQSTFIYYDGDSCPLIDIPRLKEIYGYQFQSQPISQVSDIPKNPNGSVLFVTQSAYKNALNTTDNIDAIVNIHPDFGSAMVIYNHEITDIVKDVQHVRRRETIAMTPPNCLQLLQEIVQDKKPRVETCNAENYNKIVDAIKQNTGTVAAPLIASSGLSIQYAIMMGLIEDAIKQHPEKAIKVILPPNCYGGTNDQARRIADLISNVSIVDLLVDGGQDLVTSLDQALTEVAQDNAVPIILAEIPTNPRVEVPDMAQLAQVLKVTRKTSENKAAIAPVFMVDQTFCPNVKLLHQDSPLAGVKLISFSSGSKFPSGGRCIAGYCAVNDAAEALQSIISKHLDLSDNNAIAHQLNTLAESIPSMPQRIQKAYDNTRQLVSHVQTMLPTAKINFVSEALAAQGFTPSVFSLDLPSTGHTQQEREENKRILNAKLINFMIERHPEDCKYCVSYGQLKGSYWTIPATSTQGTTKEKDKDYIIRVALSPDVNVSALAESFTLFCHDSGLS